MRIFFKNKIIAFSILVMFLFSTVCTTMVTYAAESNRNGDTSCEVVILLDTSGSMNASDPDIAGARISTEASKSFAYLRTSYSDMYISLIAYNYSVKTVLDKTNVSTELGMAKYENAVDSIYNNTVSGFECWSSMTDIGSALEQANEILKNSSSSKKAVLLFTDGRTELPTKEELNQSLQKVSDSRDSFEKSGIPVYTVGLNLDDSVDVEFLGDLADKTNGKSIIAISASELVQYFNDIYADLFGTIQKNNDPITLTGEKQSYQFNIYGEAIKEANISLYSDSPIGQIQVLTPTGVDVSNNPKMCTINSSVKIANIKILDPMDGMWTISFIGQSGGILRINELHLYDISLTTDQNNKIDLNYGDTLKLNTYLHNNEKNIAISSTKIYADSQVYIEIIDSAKSLSALYPGIINDSSNGFHFDLPFDRPGDYTLQCTLYNDQIMVDSEIINLNVKEPVLSLKTDENGKKVERGEGADFSISLINNPEEGKTINVPDFLKDTTGKLLVNLDGNLIDSIAFDIKESNENKTVEVKYIPLTSGNYTFTVALQNGNYNLESKPVDIEFLNSQISSDFPKNISHTLGIGKDESVVYDLNKYFKDSDNDILKFKLIGVNENDDKATVELDSANNSLTVSFLKKGQSVIEIEAYDDFGAVLTHSVKINVKSLMDMIILIIVVVVIVIILLAVAAIIVLLRKRIAKRFKLSLNIMQGGADIYKISANIQSLKSKKGYDKPYIKLWDILSERAWFPDGVSFEFKEYCSHMTLTGQVLDGGFKIICKVKGQKNKIFNGKNTVTFRFADKDKTLDKYYTVTFSQFEL